MQRFLLQHNPSLFGLLLGQLPVAQWSFLALLTTIAVGVALHNVFQRFFVKPCFHWVATRELRLITLWNPPTSVMFCYFGGRFFLGAPSFFFSLVRSTILVHFWSAHLFYFVDFLKNVSLALICTVYMIGSSGSMAAIGFRIFSPKQTQLQHLPPANCSEPPPRIHSFCVAPATCGLQISPICKPKAFTYLLHLKSRLSWKFAPA
jgi:hypothetical protein